MDWWIIGCTNSGSYFHSLFKLQTLQLEPFYISCAIVYIRSASLSLEEGPRVRFLSRAKYSNPKNHNQNFNHSPIAAANVGISSSRSLVRFSKSTRQQ